MEWFYKLLAETEKKKIFISVTVRMMKLYELCKDYLKLSNVESGSHRDWRNGSQMKNHGATFTTVKKRCKGYFLLLMSLLH